MCTGGSAGNATDRRTPEDHDLSTLVNAYTNWPPPPVPPPSTTSTTHPPPPSSGGGTGKPSCEVMTGNDGLVTTNGVSVPTPVLPEIVRGCV